MTLPSFGVKYPVTTVMFFLAFLLLGLVSLMFLPIDLMPEIEPPAISVITSWPGSAAEDIENKVTKIIENDLSIVNNLDEIQSISQEDLSLITCKFRWSTNLDEASNEIRDRLEFCKRLLPDDAEVPIVFKFSTSLFPIAFFGVTAQESLDKLEEIMDDQMASPLKRIPGVGAVQMIAGKRRQININMDLQKLQAYSLTREQVEAALASENLTLPAGSLKIGRIEYILRIPGEYEKVKDIPNIVVKKDKDSFVYLRDIATVEDGFREAKRIVEINQRPGMLLAVQKRSGTNTVEVLNSCFRELENIKKTLPQDIQIFTLFDSADFIKNSLRNLGETIFWGALFVVLTTIFFLRQIRTSIIIAITIPFSLILAFIFMYIFQYTINVMSLASLAIAIGMVVDNAIVILENIVSHKDRGERIQEAAIFGASEVGLAVSASTLTTVVIFLPLIFVSGISGIMFRQLALIITVVLLSSLLISLTLTPMLASKILKTQNKTKSSWGKKFFLWSEAIFASTENAYSDFLDWTLHHRKTVIFWSVCCFLAALFLVPLIGSEFVPEEDTGDLSMEFEMPVGTRLEVTRKKAQDISRMIMQMFPKETKDIFFRVGQSEDGFGSAFGEKEGSHVGLVALKLVKQRQRKLSSKEIGRKLVLELENDIDIRKISLDTGNPMDKILLGGNKPISIEIIGHDLVETDALANQLKKIMQNTPGAMDVIISRDIGKPELKVVIDRQKASDLGLNIAHIVQTLRTYFYGKEVSRYRQGDKEYDIFLRLQDSQRTEIGDVCNSTIPLPHGEQVRLDSFASVKEGLGPIKIERKNQERMVIVGASTYQRSLGEVMSDIEKEINQIDRPAGIAIQIGGIVKIQRESFRDMSILLALGALLVYMVMASQFESLRHPFVIMFSVPFAFVGVFIFLFLTGTTLNLLSLIGMILLIGVVVNNAIVLVDYTNILRARGLSIMEAIKKAGAQRLRPVLITTFTTIFGMIPLAVSKGEGSEIWKPLGITVIGGLFVSTLITMVLVPVLYSLFNKENKKGLYSQ
ncbi:MAG: efflux RND transporter permease subunit [Candidatus Brocadiae bacterium]|nr:efflux RND transporter permease subunit [Candidatus Brocadiia bacterium]